MSDPRTGSTITNRPQGRVGHFFLSETRPCGHFNKNNNSNEQIDVSIKTILNTFVSLFFDSNNRFENQAFIELTTISKTNSEHITKQNIEQSLNDFLSVDDLIDQSTKQGRKHLLAANNTILFVRDIRNQDFKFSSHQTTNCRSHKIN